MLPAIKLAAVRKVVFESRTKLLAVATMVIAPLAENVPAEPDPPTNVKAVAGVTAYIDVAFSCTKTRRRNRARIGQYLGGDVDVSTIEKQSSLN